MTTSMTRWHRRLPLSALPIDRGRLRRLAWSGFTAALVTGCTFGPEYKRPEVPLPSAWRAPMQETADVVNTAWWEAFGDAELNALIKTAIDENKDLALATLRIEQFDAKLEVSRAARYPQVNYGVNAERQRRSEERPNVLPANAPITQNVFEIGPNVKWELDLWGKVKRSNEAALADLLSTEESRRAVMLSVVSSVATSYVQLLGLDQQLDIARQAVKNRQDAADLIEQKYKGGSSTRLNVAKARAAADEASAALPPIERDIATLENALSSLIGRPLGVIARRSIDRLALPPIPQGVPSDVLSRRPDVLAAEQTLVAANARIGVAKTEYFPTLSLTGAIGLASDQLKFLDAKTARTADIGAQLLGTIFSGGRIEGDIRQTEAVQRQMVVTYRQAVQTALQEVDDALVFRAKSAEQADALGRQVGWLKEASQLTRQRQEGGQSSVVDVLDADFKLYEGQSRQAQSRRDTVVALISIYKAMGGGWMVEQDKQRAVATASPPRAPGEGDDARSETKAQE